MPKPLQLAAGRYVTSTVSGRAGAGVSASGLCRRTHERSTSLQTILTEANQGVGRLDGMTSAFPDLNLFFYPYVRKDAVLSSQIEGTQSSIADLLLNENSETPGVPLDDVHEVSNYVAALNHGLKRRTPARCRFQRGRPARSIFERRQPVRNQFGGGKRSDCTTGEVRRSVGKCSLFPRVEAQTRITSRTRRPARLERSMMSNPTHEAPTPRQISRQRTAFLPNPYPGRPCWTTRNISGIKKFHSGRYFTNRKSFVHCGRRAIARQNSVDGSSSQNSTT
jgi:Fic/DOC family N-terminal